MKNEYHVKVIGCKEVHELPGAWDKQNLLDLLEAIEYDDAASIQESDLKEMTAMALTDLEPEEASETLLSLRLGDKLSKGQRQNLFEDFKEDKIWEEYAEIDFHKELFNCACMLRWAFEREFPTPDIVKITLNIEAKNAKSSANLKNPTASFIARLLTDGMDEHNSIKRLFDDQLKARLFPEATSIIWQFSASTFDESTSTVELTIYTSWNWVDELKYVNEFSSAAYTDGEEG